MFDPADILQGTESDFRNFLMLKIACLTSRGDKYPLLFVESGQTKANIEGPMWASSLVYVCKPSLIILLIAAGSVPTPGGHTGVKPLIIER